MSVQVIARENKQGEFGIDYKFSDMVDNYANGRDQYCTTSLPDKRKR